MSLFRFTPAMLGVTLALTAQGAAAQGTVAQGGGLYTDAQAARGKALYLDSCTGCHGGGLGGGEDAPPLAGSAFLDKWGKLPVAALFGFINIQMPLGAPGSLGAQGNADITAYILSYNHQPAGPNELPPDAKALGSAPFTAP